MSKVTNTESFIEKANTIHNFRYDYSKTNYIKSKLKLFINCKIHGEFEQTASDHLKGWGCSKCSGKNKPTTEEWIELAESIHSEYDYSKVIYVDNKTSVEVICRLHGSFFPTPSNHIIKKTKCPKCNDLLKHLKYKKSTEQFVMESKQIHNNKYDYSNVDYIDKKIKVKIICPTHGEFEQSPSSHLAGSGCSKCKLKNQTKLFEKLKESFIKEEIVWEYSPNWLDRQRFDIYFLKYNIAVEYNGQLHYNSIEYFGGDEKYELQQERDKLKREKCNQNDCNLFEVKYNYNENDYEILINSIKLTIKNKKQNYESNKQNW